MPRDQNGVYTPARNWINDANANVPFSPERWWEQDSDFADALNDLPLKAKVPVMVSAGTNPATVNPGSLMFYNGRWYARPTEPVWLQIGPGITDAEPVIASAVAASVAAINGDVMAAHAAAADPHPQYTTSLELDAAIGAALSGGGGLANYWTKTEADGRYDAAGAAAAEAIARASADTGLSTAIADAVAALKGNVSAGYDTLKKIEDKLGPVLAGANSAYDTFAEIYAYITSDQSAAAAVNGALANRVRVDAAQGLSAPQQLQARSNINAAPVEAAAALGLIVNPCMEISQESGANAVSVTGGGAYTVDQMLAYTVGMLVTSWQQISDPFSTAAGFRRLRSALRATITTPEASLAAGSFANIAQPIEGTFWRSLGWGTADAMAIDIVAVVSASVAGNYTLTVRNGAQNRSYCAPVALAANTPTVVLVTVPGDTSGEWATDTIAAARIGLTAACGSTYQAVSANTWEGANKFGLAGAANLASATGATLTIGYLNVFPHGVLPWSSASEITGEALQRLLNMRRPYDDDLRRCQRYYFKDSGNSSTFACIIDGTNYGLTYFFPVAMRANPAVTASGSTGSLSAYVASTTYVGLFRSGGWNSPNITADARM